MTTTISHPCTKCKSTAGTRRRRGLCSQCWRPQAQDLSPEQRAELRQQAALPLPPYGTAAHENALALRARLGMPMKLATDGAQKANLN